MNDEIAVFRTSSQFLRTIWCRLGLTALIALAGWPFLILGGLSLRQMSLSEFCTFQLQQLDKIFGLVPTQGRVTALMIFWLVLPGVVCLSKGIDSVLQWRRYRIELHPDHIEVHGLGKQLSAPWHEIGKILQLQRTNGSLDAVLLFPYLNSPILLVGLNSFEEVLAIVRTRLPPSAKREIKTIRGIISPLGLLKLEAIRKNWHDLMSLPNPYDVP